MLYVMTCNIKISELVYGKCEVNKMVVLLRILGYRDDKLFIGLGLAAPDYDPRSGLQG